jgi:fimbrial isopeptide formation D2 family protein/LPXTG-motif cell wall-anchored protein
MLTPKKTQYADVTINKKDIIANKGLSNVGFKLDESIDNQKTWTAVAGGTNNVYYTDSTGAFTWEHLPAQRYYRINEVSVPDAKYICNDDEYIVFYINSAGEVEMQNQSSLSFGTVLKVNGDATNTITINNDYITTDKFIMNGTTQGKDATAKIGDNVNWKLTATVPEEMAKMKKYDIIDTMSTGLQYVSATINGLDANGKSVYAFVENTDYTITNSESTNKKVTFSFTTTGCKRAVAVNVKTIVVNYTTLVTTDAPLGTAINNSSSVTYSNKFATTSNYTVDTTNPPEVHTSGFQFKKITSNSSALQGVTFKIYATEEDAQAGTNALSFYTYNSTGNLVKTQIATSDADGLVSIMGLTYGTFGNKVNEGTTKYYIVETSTPTGYNLLKDPFEITVGQNTYSYTNTKFDVVNTSKLNLPKTGVIAGTGVAGVGIICLGIALAFAMKKKKNSKTSN